MRLGRAIMPYRYFLSFALLSSSLAWAGEDDAAIARDAARAETAAKAAEICRRQQGPERAACVRALARETAPETALPTPISPDQ